MARSIPKFALAALLFALPGCVHHGHSHAGHGRARPPVVGVHKPGPPPHAPAHGHRHRHHRHRDVELVFDSAIGVYLVVGLADHFYADGHFYRIVNGTWQVSVRIDREWRIARAAKLPRGLAKQHRKAKHRGKKHGPHPAKHGGHRSGH